MSFRRREKRAGSQELSVRGITPSITTTTRANKAGEVLGNLRAFRATVWRHYKKNGRHDLPWRKTKDPYRILVSEVMLQQTQAPRVVEKYKSFLKKFPTVQALAAAPLADVLKEWSGLGYNRRAKYLHDAANAMLPSDGRQKLAYEELRSLPGVGEYTARAVRVFAYNEPEILIETNVRTAFLHHFADIHIECGRIGSGKVADRDLLPLIQKVAKGQDPRTWHWALMDYGAYLKRSGVRNNHQSAHYTKQSKFEGSLRQVRGIVLRELSADKTISGLRNHYMEKIDVALARLEKDGLIKKVKGKWRLPDR